MGVRQIDRFLEQWQTGARYLLWRQHPGSGNDGTPSGASPRMDGFGCGASLGTGNPHTSERCAAAFGEMGVANGRLATPRQDLLLTAVAKLAQECRIVSNDAVM